MKNSSKNQDYLAKGGFFERILPALLLMFAWFLPYRKWRVFFHKCRGCNIGKNVEIGYFCIIGNVHPSMITLEDNVVVTARTTILEHDNAMYYTGRGSVNIAPVVIKKNAFIGIGSTIMPGVTVGQNSIIAPHSFVNKDIPNDVLAGGCPAQIIKKY
ncbi:MAG: acyltransferase [Muribaculum sp.]|nr:acyltransferase [Muribaculum sp.]